MLPFLKRVARERCPEWVAAYHQLRLYRASRRFPTGISPYGFSCTGPAGMHDGTFEPAAAAFIHARLQHAGVFVDIGANVGYFACLARHAGRTVVAVEPAQRNLELLFRNLAGNGWSDVEIYPLGLGPAPGLATLYGDGTSASLVRRWAGVSEAWQRTIPVSTLDTLLGSRFAAESLLIKIDVEGFEYDVLRGAALTLARVPAPVWLVEICFDENFGGRINPHFLDAFRLFWHAGYSAVTLESGRRVTEDDVRRWIDRGRRDFGDISYVFERRNGAAA